MTPPPSSPPPSGFRARASRWLAARRALLPGLLIVLVATAARLALIRTARFTGDEAGFYATARAIADLQSWPGVGPALTGGAARHPGPTFFFLMAVPQLFTRAPEASSALVAVLAGVTVGLVWAALRRPFGAAGAGLAGALLACLPWAVLEGDRIWNGDVMLLPIALALWAASRLREAPRSRHVVALAGACAVMPHFAMSAPVVWLGLAVLVAPTARRWDRRALKHAALVALALYLPYLVYELVNHGANTRAFLAETFGRGASTAGPGAAAPAAVPPEYRGVGRVLAYAARMLTLDVTYHELTGYWRPLTESQLREALLAGTDVRPHTPLRLLALAASALLAALAVLALLVAALRPDDGRRASLRGPARAFGLAALVALGACVALLGLTHKIVFPHYVLPLLPFFAAAFAALGNLASRRRATAWAVAALAAVVCAGGLEASWTVSRRVEARHGLHVMRAVIASIAADGEREGLGPREPVRLEWGYPGGFEVPYNLLSAGVFNSRVVVSPFGRRRIYRLERREARPPPTWYRPAPTLEVGPVVLYRLLPQ